MALPTRLFFSFRFLFLFLFLFFFLTSLVVSCGLAGGPTWAGATLNGVELRLSRGPGPDDVTLQWTGGQPPFAVHRSTLPWDVTEPINQLGTTNANTWTDTAFAADLYFYSVEITCIPTPEICDGIDNDCDPLTLDGAEDPLIGAPCDGHDTDLCLEGTTYCGGGALACLDITTSTLDLCNGLDDDCDPASADGTEDPQVGMVCDGPDSDLCLEGTISCAGGSLVCSDNTGSTVDLCNGVNDDCDLASADGAEDPQLGAPCDGPDSDLCLEGTISCAGGSLVCSDNTGSTVDLCNGINDDCDAASADGSEDPLVGTACDGPDSDLCLEGTISCAGGSLVCSDNTGSTVDLCNGANDDCDAASADGSEDPLVGTACDGPDSDLCLEGTRFCAAAALACSDNTSSTVDLCNGANDDCDAASADGSEDPQVGAACDGPDGDVCLEGTWSCTAGSLVCSDASGTTVELCNGAGADEDCDGQIDEDFIRNDNPACTAGQRYLGTVAGDVGTDIRTDGNFNEEWDRITITEEDSGIFTVYLSATIQLTSPPGTDFDLYVYCVGCGGTLAGSSTVGGLTGHTDVVRVRADDQWGFDDTFDVIVEVRHYTSALCANWSLTITGNTVVSSATCD